MLYKVVLPFGSVDKILLCTIQMKTTEQYFPVMLLLCCTRWIYTCTWILRITHVTCGATCICVFSKSASCGTVEYKVVYVLDIKDVS